jgi:uncharacterized membrane protein
MTTRAELRARARASLKGNWGRAILIFFLMGLILGVSGGILSLIHSNVQIVFNLIVTGPFTLGLTTAFLELAGNKRPAVSTLFIGFRSFSKTFLLYLLLLIFSILWTLLLIVPGIIAGFRYSQAFYILRDNPEISPLEAIRRSKTMMIGHKWRLFVLYLSFIGWWLLGILTLGIGYLWLYPYVMTTMAHFYLDLRSRNSSYTSGNPISLEK